MRKIILFAVIFVLLPVVDVLADFIINQDTTINSGTYGLVDVLGGAKLDYYGDYIDVLRVEESSSAAIYGGTVHNIQLGDSETLYLLGGSIWLLQAQNSTVHIYGQGITLNPVGNDTYIQGLWGNDIPFSFTAGRTALYNEQFIIHEIPEPATSTLLLTAGVFLFRRRR